MHCGAMTRSDSGHAAWSSQALAAGQTTCGIGYWDLALQHWNTVLESDFLWEYLAERARACDQEALEIFRSINDARAIQEVMIFGVQAWIFPVFQNRYNKAVRFLHQAIQKGKLGKLALGTVRLRWCRQQAYYERDAWRGTWAMDGGSLMNQGVHYVDLLRWCMGPVTEVTAVCATQAHQVEVEVARRVGHDVLRDGHRRSLRRRSPTQRHWPARQMSERLTLLTSRWR
mgnify:CR=1 FL=1